MNKIITRKLCAVFTMLIVMITVTCAFSTAASAAQTPYYKIVSRNGQKITSRTDYYDIKGGKTVKIHLAYENSGVRFTLCEGRANWGRVGAKDVFSVLQSKAKFTYIIRNSKGKVVKSYSGGSGLSAHNTFKLPAGSNYRVYITSRFTESNAKTTALKQAADYGRYYLTY